MRPSFHETSIWPPTEYRRIAFSQITVSELALAPAHAWESAKRSVQPEARSASTKKVSAPSIAWARYSSARTAAISAQLKSPGVPVQKSMLWTKWAIALPKHESRTTWSPTKRRPHQPFLAKYPDGRGQSAESVPPRMAPNSPERSLSFSFRRLFSTMKLNPTSEAFRARASAVIIRSSSWKSRVGGFST